MEKTLSFLMNMNMDFNFRLKALTGFLAGMGTNLFTIMKHLNFTLIRQDSNQ